jgi:hypothetical protein
MTSPAGLLAQARDCLCDTRCRNLGKLPTFLASQRFDRSASDLIRKSYTVQSVS